MLGELKKTFRPEFLNRVDDIIVFNKLNEKEIIEIARHMLKELSDRLGAMEITVEFSDAAVKAVSDEGYDPVYGARPLRRAITSKIEDPLSEKSWKALSRRTIRSYVTIKTVRFVLISNKNETIKTTKNPGSVYSEAGFLFHIAAAPAVSAK